MRATRDGGVSEMEEEKVLAHCCRGEDPEARQGVSPARCHVVSPCGDPAAQTRALTWVPIEPSVASGRLAGRALSMAIALDD